MEYKKIGEIAEVVSGSTPRTNVDEYWDGDLPWITPAELEKNKQYVYETKRKLTGLGVRSSSLKLLPRDTVLLTSRAPIGKVAMAAVEMYCNQGFKNLVCNTKLVYPKYLFYWLSSKTEYLNSLGRGATFKEVSKSIVEQIEVPLPKIEEQKMLVTALDKAQELIDKRKEQIEACDELIRGLFHHMFGEVNINNYNFEVTDIESVASKITDGDHSTPIRSTDGIKLLSARNIKNSYIDFEAGLDYVKQDEYERMIRRCNPEYGDILISCSGTIGRVSRVYITEPFVLVRSVALVKLKLERVNPIFLERCLQTSYVQAIMNKSANKSGQANLFNNQIKRIPIILPPLELQNRFAEQVEKIEKQKQRLQQSLIELENNFNALMQQAFKGELF